MLNQILLAAFMQEDLVKHKRIHTHFLSVAPHKKGLSLNR